ncbi:MAG TPA: putative nucleotidyltransferase substrate binding domain-containing protein [Kiritimatiellia bacterium]|nr:putative nucleotidyltransferase substrate binding domain-containing protein [Kiritimatiellia bacterium]
MGRTAITRILAPTILTALLFVVAIYWVLIPAVERAVMERKREMIRELTVSAWNILANHEEMERAGEFSREEAQRLAIAQLRHLHYGPMQKDYFWINDLQPRMIMHPYRTELEGMDLAGYTDPDGRLLFTEAVAVVRRDGEGYLTYRWQRRDREEQIVPKLSFVKGFEPWAWMLGTGIYIDDVQAEIRRFTNRLTAVSTVIMAVVSILLAFVCRESLRIERRRRTAEQALARAADALRTRVDTLEEAEAMQRRTIEDLSATLDLVQPDAPGPAKWREEIQRAANVSEIAASNQSFPTRLQTLILNGARAACINQLLSANADAVASRLIELAIRDLGQPPANFAFLVMGSQGRRESTLKTDQDHALLYADPAIGHERACADYFLALGARISDGLAAAGYALCAGGIMARNAAWCRPLSAWKERCAGWIEGLEAEDLLQAKIFFDFRCIHGDPALAAELHSFIRARCGNAPRFFPLLARTILLYTPPLGLFGGLATETREGRRRGIDLKEAMTPLVDFARIYALRHNIAATHTLERLRALVRDGLIPRQSAEEVVQVYEALMQLRIRTQARAMESGREPDNLIEIASLTRIERRLLKEAFSQVRVFQQKLSFDFTGGTGAAA